MTAQVVPRRSRVPRLLGYGLALICLVWVLHDIHISRALRDFANVNWKWVLLGMMFDVLSYYIQAVRWKFLLHPFGRVKLSHAVRAVFAGLFANLAFPLRPGELLRSYLLSKTEDIKLGRVLGSVGVERLIDLVVATASLTIVSLFVDLPTRFKKAADTMGVVALVLLAIVVGVILYLEFRLQKNECIESNSRRFPGKLMAALIGLHAMSTSPSFYPAVLFSLLMPFLQILALWSMMKSYGLGLPFLAAVVVLLVINIGVSLPNAPANVGSYQFFCVLGLSVFQVDKTSAAGFSIFAFLALTFPFVILGFAALLRSGLSPRTLREQVSRLPNEAQRPAS
ncbi:MAG: lysylphosphatidylglycerol synthase transmembrane domain-containing protein [Candidatus Acidiferrales bacterium]